MARFPLVSLLAALVVAGSRCFIAARAERLDLVVSIPGDKEFHQPGCPLVAKAGSNVKVMKRSEALRRKLTAHAGCGAALRAAAWRSIRTR